MLKQELELEQELEQEQGLEQGLELSAIKAVVLQDPTEQRREYAEDYELLCSAVQHGAAGLDDLYALVLHWAEERNLIAGSTPQAQMLKLTEELGELAGGIAKNKRGVIQDSIGDVLVVLSILAEQEGMSLQSCMLRAWGDIKDRKGRMVNGVFVKQEDL